MNEDPTTSIDRVPAVSLERARIDFMTEVAVQLGLPVHSAAAIASAQPFASPQGLLCRLHLMQGDGPTRVRPEVLLPLSVEHLSGDDTLRMLATQAALLSTFDCWLTAAEGGWLALTSVAPLATAAEVSNALAMANALAPGIMHTITVGEGAP
jgi:hypothetical protein